MLKDKEEIIKWLKEFKVKNYELIEHETFGFVVNVNDDVNLFKKDLKSIRVYFNEIKGDFDCSYNQLMSLVGCPIKVRGNFDCRFNKINSLKFCPEIVEGYFSCSNNMVKNLIFCPHQVENGFYAEGNIALHRFQVITNFKKVYEEHCKQSIAYQKEQLQKKINLMKFKNHHTNVKKI